MAAGSFTVFPFFHTAALIFPVSDGAAIRSLQSADGFPSLALRIADLAFSSVNRASASIQEALPASNEASLDVAACSLKEAVRSYPR